MIGGLLLIRWGREFLHVTRLVDGLPVLIRGRIERKFYGLATDVAEYCGIGFLVHGQPPFTWREWSQQRAVVPLPIARIKPDPRMSRVKK